MLTMVQLMIDLFGFSFKLVILFLFISGTISYHGRTLIKEYFIAKSKFLSGFTEEEVKGKNHFDRKRNVN